MTTPASVAPPRRHFLLEIWDEKREAFKALVADAFLFLTAFLILIIVFWGFRSLERAGYPRERLAAFETLHYWAYYTVLVIFLADLIMKLFVLLILGKKQKP